MADKKFALFVLVVLCGLLMTALIRVLKLQDASSSDKNHPQDLKYRLTGPLSAQDPSMLALMRERYIFPPDPKPYNFTSNDWLYNMHNQNYGKNVRKMIKEVFSNIRGGFFIEAGALDGVYLSNTLWLEQERGWTGLLVEPNIFSYRELTMKHRKAWVSNTCLSSTPYPRQTVMVALSPENWYPFQMNIKGSSHEYGINQSDINTEQFFNSATQHLITAQCFPLVSYLLALNVSTVDFLSLDIQGSERAILDTLPWETLNIRTVVIEINLEVWSDEFINLMSSRGYQLANYTESEFLFIKKGDPLLDTVSSGR